MYWSTDHCYLSQRLFFPTAAIVEYYPEMNTSYCVKIHCILQALSVPFFFFLLNIIMIYQFIFTDAKLQ